MVLVCTMAYGLERVHWRVMSKSAWEWLTHDFGLEALDESGVKIHDIDDIAVPKHVLDRREIV